MGVVLVRWRRHDRMGVPLLYLLAWSLAGSLLSWTSLWLIGCFALTFPVAFQVMLSQNHSIMVRAHSHSIERTTVIADHGCAAARGYVLPMAGRDNSADLESAWHGFVEQLKAVGDQAISSAPNDIERLDGLRFVLRQLAYREEQFIEFPRGATPEFFDPESPTRKIFADCPDTIYRQFNIADGGVYRLSGTRGDSPYISFTAYRSAITDRVVADLHDGELDIADDGTFDLTIGGPEQTTNWLDTVGAGAPAAVVIIREYCHDRANGRHATFEIEQVEPAPTHRPELDLDTFTGSLAIMGLGLTFAQDATIKLSEELRLRPNQMNEAAADLVSEMAGTPHNHYQLCFVRLDDGQAVELELDPPDCRYWSVHLNNWWLESPEFRDGQSVCINDSQAERDPDGVIRIRVGPDDPGAGNWLDTKGRRETILLARYLLPDGDLPAITPRVIDI